MIVLIGPGLEVQISNQSVLSLLGVLSNSSFCISTQKWEHLSNQEPHSSSTYAGVSMVNIPRDTNESRPVECVLYLLLSDYSQIVSLCKCKMSMATMEYIYGIWSIRDNCYECRVIRSLDMSILCKGCCCCFLINPLKAGKNSLFVKIQRQPQEHQPGLLFSLVWMNCQYHELEMDYIVFTLIIHTLISTNQVTLIN